MINAANPSIFNIGAAFCIQCIALRDLMVSQDFFLGVAINLLQTLEHFYKKILENSFCFLANIFMSFCISSISIYLHAKTVLLQSQVSKRWEFSSSQHCQWQYPCGSILYKFQHCSHLEGIFWNRVRANCQCRSYQEFDNLRGGLNPPCRALLYKWFKQLYLKQTC